MCAAIVFGRFAMLYLMDGLVNALDASVEGWTAQELESGQIGRRERTDGAGLQ